MWKTLRIIERQIGLDLTRNYGCLVRWCAAHSCHIQHLHIHVARDRSVRPHEVRTCTACADAK